MSRASSTDRVILGKAPGGHGNWKDNDKTFVSLTPSVSQVSH